MSCPWTIIIIYYKCKMYKNFTFDQNDMQFFFKITPLAHFISFAPCMNLVRGSGMTLIKNQVAISTRLQLCKLTI
jgi:hypothetical protein